MHEFHTALVQDHDAITIMNDSTHPHSWSEHIRLFALSSNYVDRLLRGKVHVCRRRGQGASCQNRSSTDGYKAFSLLLPDPTLEAPFHHRLRLSSV